jgi:hypothetical protein
MKIMCVAYLLFLSSPTLNAQALSDKEADSAWFKLQVITSGETESARLAHLKSHGISHDGARALVERVAQGEVKMQEVPSSIVGLICANQEALRNSGQEGFAQLVERFHAAESETRRQLVLQALESLSEMDRMHLNHLMSDEMHGPKVNTRPSQVVSKIRDGRISVEFAIERTCGRVAS